MLIKNKMIEAIARSNGKKQLQEYGEFKDSLL
jgi:hypothetical protein